MDFHFTNIKVPDLLVEWHAEDEDVPSDIVRWAADQAEDMGKVSFSYSEEYQGYSVTITCKREDLPNKYRVMSLWGNSLGNAAFKMYIAHGLYANYGRVHWQKAEEEMKARAKELLSEIRNNLTS